MSRSKLAKVSAIVFDLDDTLFPTGEWAVPALEFAAKVAGFDSHRFWELATQYVHDIGYADAGIYNYVLLGAGQSDSALNIRALVSAVNTFRPAPGSLQLHQGAVEAIVSLSSKYHLAIMADGPVECQQAKIIGLGLESACSVIVYSDQIAGIRSRRPDPRPYQLVLERLKTRSDGVLFVGDNPLKDFIRAKQLGFSTARVITGEYASYPNPSTAHAADYEISSVASLPDLMLYGEVRSAFGSPPVQRNKPITGTKRF